MSAIRSERGVMVPLRCLVPLPNTTITVDIGRELSKRAVDAAQAENGEIFLFTQIHPDVETPDMEALYPIGVRAEVTKLEKNTAINGYKITLDIGQRVQALLVLEEEDGMLMMRVFPIYDDYSSEAAKALTQKTEARLQTELLRFNRLTRKLSSAQLTMIQNQTDIAKKIDIMTHLVVSQMETAMRCFPMSISISGWKNS